MSARKFIDNDWWVRARTLHNNVPCPANGEKLCIPKSNRCIPKMKGSTGVPVNAELAVTFIRNFRDNFTLHKHKFTPQFVQSLHVAGADPTIAQDEHKKAVHRLKKIVDLSHGMTFDRDLILKILSQSGCEGIRLYMCARPKDGSLRFLNKDEDYDVSLVVVGVDRHGCDHRYKPNGLQQGQPHPGQAVINIASNIAPSDGSAIGEYSTPPDSDQPDSDTDDSTTDKLHKIDARFALSELARTLNKTTVPAQLVAGSGH